MRSHRDQGTDWSLRHLWFPRLTMAELSVLEQTLGIAFKDKSLLRRALVHRSYLNEHPEFPLEDNERLEFLGDAVLDFLTGEYLYNRFPELAEGPLTSLRSALVRRETLARFAENLELGQHLLMGLGEVATGGRERPATLCAAFEALVGALYLDQGKGAVEQLIEPLVAPEVARIVREHSDKDDKSRLQELVQGQLRCTPRYVTVRQSGPDHAKQFTVEVTINGEVFGRGTGLSKQQAAQNAAQEALARFDGMASETSGNGSQDAPIQESG
jgi:ribonuclease-3